MFCPNDTWIAAQLPDRKNVFFGGAADTGGGGRYAYGGGGGGGRPIRRAADMPFFLGGGRPIRLCGRGIQIRLKASTMKSQSFTKIMRLPM